VIRFLVSFYRSEVCTHAKINFDFVSNFSIFASRRSELTLELSWAFRLSAASFIAPY
jgi:hypothetical protein